MSPPAASKTSTRIGSSPDGVSCQPTAHPSPDRHDRVYDSIEQTRALLNDLGRARPEIQPEARSIVIEPWLALYCIAEDGAQVMRIMDGARDLSAIE